ncbi:MAG: hypothetical protein ACREKH_21235 [Candidatus Rokuibacteriota bacterium]
MRRRPVLVTTVLSLLIGLAGSAGVPSHAGPPVWPGTGIGTPSWPSGPAGFTPPVRPGVFGPPTTPGQPATPGTLNVPLSQPRVKPPPVEPCRLRSAAVSAEILFSAVLFAGGRREDGRSFEFGAVRDLLIEVRWASLDASARQRLELYGPDRHLYQMFTTVLPAHAAPVEIRVPVSSSWITSATLVGSWCAKVFLDDNLDPAGAETFELRRPRPR